MNYKSNKTSNKGGMPKTVNSGVIQGKPKKPNKAKGKNKTSQV